MKLAYQTQTADLFATTPADQAVCMPFGLRCLQQAQDIHVNCRVGDIYIYDENMLKHYFLFLLLPQLRSPSLFCACLIRWGVRSCDLFLTHLMNFVWPSRPRLVTATLMFRFGTISAEPEPCCWFDAQPDMRLRV